MVPSEMWSRFPTSRFESPIDTNSMIYLSRGGSAITGSWGSHRQRPTRSRGFKDYRLAGCATFNIAPLGSRICWRRSEGAFVSMQSSRWLRIRSRAIIDQRAGPPFGEKGKQDSED
jgi:hypothetical protein